MFEKEAEERARKLEESLTLGVYDNEEDLRYDEGYNSGEVVGYEEGFQDGAEFGYNKANEWHYVKDGDLPEHEVNVLVFVNKQCIDIAHYNYDYKEWHFADSIVYDVVAWKEIVLPKEIK